MAFYSLNLCCIQCNCNKQSQENFCYIFPENIVKFSSCTQKLLEIVTSTFAPKTILTMTSTIVAIGVQQILKNNTMVQALFDSLIEKVLDRVSDDLPTILHSSIRQAISSNQTYSNHSSLQQYSSQSINNIDNPSSASHSLIQAANGSHVSTNGLNGSTSSLTEEQKSMSNSNNNTSSSDKNIPTLQLQFCDSVLNLVEKKLAQIEVLQMSDLNVSLSHLSDAKHALSRGNMKRFEWFIEQSYMKAREAQYKVPNDIYRIYVYSLLIFNGFLIFSDFGKDYVSGLSHIMKCLSEINFDNSLNTKLDNSLKSYFYWTQEEKCLIAHSTLFSCKVSALIRAIQYKIRFQRRMKCLKPNISANINASNNRIQNQFRGNSSSSFNNMHGSGGGVGGTNLLANNFQFLQLNTEMTGNSGALAMPRQLQTTSDYYKTKRNKIAQTKGMTVVDDEKSNQNQLINTFYDNQDYALVMVCYILPY